MKLLGRPESGVAVVGVFVLGGIVTLVMMLLMVVALR